MSVLKNQKKQQKYNWHRADIIAALHKKGWSLNKLAAYHGLSPSTLKSALDKPYPKSEKIIAKAIGKTVEDIWPEREAYRNFTPTFPSKQL